MIFGTWTVFIVQNQLLRQELLAPIHGYDDPSGPKACVSGDSKIMTTLDGEVIEAKRLEEGNEIVYYDFKTKENKIGKIIKKHIHKKATNFITYTFDDNSYLQVTDYHPIYTKEGWKSFTRKNGYEKPQINDKVKSAEAWKKLIRIEEWNGKEDYYDFAIEANDGSIIDNYFANDTLVQSSI